MILDTWPRNVETISPLKISMISMLDPDDAARWEPPLLNSMTWHWRMFTVIRHDVSVHVSKSHHIKKCNRNDDTHIYSYLMSVNGYLLSFVMSSSLRSIEMNLMLSRKAMAKYNPFGCIATFTGSSAYFTIISIFLAWVLYTLNVQSAATDTRKGLHKDIAIAIILAEPLLFGAWWADENTSKLGGVLPLVETPWREREEMDCHHKIER